MSLGCMHFRAPHAAIKQKNYHNSPNIQPITSLHKLTKRHLLASFSIQLRVFCLSFRHASISSDMRISSLFDK